MHRRKYIDRVNAYIAGTETGAEKYARKKGIMRVHYLGVAKFTAMVNDIAASVLDEYGVVGPDRGSIQSAALRIGRFIVKYWKMNDERLANLIEAVIAEQTAEAGLEPGSQEEAEHIEILRQIAAKLITRKQELVRAYNDGYAGELSDRMKNISMVKEEGGEMK